MIADNPYDVATLLDLVNAAVDDEGFTIFCFDYLPPVYQKFATGQTESARVRMLVVYTQINDVRMNY
jgi:hypothetical protein